MLAAGEVGGAVHLHRDRRGGRASGCAALLWDERCLYLGMKVSEPRLAYVRAEGDASADDAIELYLNPGVPEMEYLTLAVNPLGQLCLTVHLIDNPGWGTDHPRQTGGIRAAARLTGDGWQVELAIPFGEYHLPVPKVGDAWRGNICRNDKLNYAWSYWSLREDALADYSDVQLFPYLRFTGHSRRAAGGRGAAGVARRPRDLPCAGSCTIPAGGR